MITINKPCYRCEYCRKLYELKHYAEAHETKCKKNPANNRPCFYCEHSEMKDVEYWCDTGWSEDSIMVKALYCMAKKIHIYPPTVTLKGSYGYEFGDIENHPMPVTCKVFDEIYINETNKWKGAYSHVPQNVLCVEKVKTKIEDMKGYLK